MKLRTTLIGGSGIGVISHSRAKESADIIIVDNCSRAKLGEGRAVGMAFAMLKETANNKYETISPFSPCKDYLNDVIYTEHTGITMGACGLQTLPKQGILNNRYIYLGIKFLNRKESDDENYTMSLAYTNDAKSKITREEHIEFYNKNLDFCNRILNDANLHLGLIGVSQLIPTKEKGQFLLSIPLQYGYSTYLISLITGLVRSLVLRRLVSVNDNIEFLPFLKEISKVPTIEQQIIRKIFKIYDRYSTIAINHDIPIFDFLAKQDFNMYKANPSSIHSEGIMTY